MRQIVFLASIFTIFTNDSGSVDPIKRQIIDCTYFQLERPDSAIYDAILYHGLMHDYVVNNSNSGISFKFKVWVEFVPSKSYFTKKSKYTDSLLLSHEQGHADIAIIYARELLKRLQTTKYKKIGFKQKIADISSSIRDSIYKQHQLYDFETKHGTILIKQKAWTDKFDRYFEQNR